MLCYAFKTSWDFGFKNFTETAYWKLIESGRIGVKLTPEVPAKLKEKLAQEPTEIGGRRIENINRMDGVKFLFGNNAWMLMRPSGTEPVFRIYAESEDKHDLENLLEQGSKYLL